MKKPILIPGLISGFIVAIVMISAVTYCYNTGRFEGSMLLGYASMILAFSLIFVAVKNLRDKHYNGIISFVKAFKAGLLVTLITSTVYVLAWLFCYYLFIPDFMEQYSNYTLQKAANEGVSAAEIAKQTAQLQQYSEMYKNPLFVILFTYLEIFPVGFIMSLVAALALKRKNPRQPQQFYTAAPKSFYRESPIVIVIRAHINCQNINRESSNVN